MSGIKLTQVDETTIPTPETGKDIIFVDIATGEPSYKDDTGTVTSLQGIAGPGVPVGGTTGQVLAKIDATNYNTQWITVAGTGDVVGPASSTADYVALFDGTTGKLLKQGTGTLGTAAYTAAAAYATAAQGATADSAVQPGDLALIATTGALLDATDFPGGTSNFLRADGSFAAPAGGGSPGGLDTQVQFNDAGSFGGDAGLVYNKTTDTLTLVNGTFTGLALTAASATGDAGFRLPHGAAPTSPVDGDVWTTSAGGMYVRINGVTVGPLAAAGSGGLTGFTSSLETASPNNTINASVLTPDGGSTVQDMVLQPKTVAGGALMLTIPDNLSAGGNKRGANAVDLQISRGAAAQVASGTRSFIAGGQNNTASGTNSLAAGSSSTANTTNAIALGATATASGTRSTAIGGQSGIASATDATAIGGGTANAVESFAFGPGANARSVVGGVSWGQTGTQPAAQMILYGSTTSATPVVLTTNGAAAAVTNQYSLGSGVNNQGAVMSGLVIARHTGSGRTKSWKFDAHINSVTGTVSLAAAVTPVIIADPGPETWTVAITANNTTKSLAVTATGEASTTIRWQCLLEGVEVSGF